MVTCKMIGKRVAWYFCNSCSSFTCNHVFSLESIVLIAGQTNDVPGAKLLLMIFCCVLRIPLITVVPYFKRGCLPAAANSLSQMNVHVNCRSEQILEIPFY